MTRFRNLFVGAMIGLLSAETVFGCLWDYDTLQMERSRFPDALELTTGKFLRHSEEFYQWRIEDRQSHLASDPDNLRFLDDLAVAYDKTGQHDKAIATMRRKEDIEPGGYETYANLGTFYIHSGQLAEGLEYIERAIEINPDAHFGREVYQKRIVEYVLANQIDGKLSLPISTDKRNREKRVGFARFLFEDRNLSVEESREELSKAVKGVLGMMRFGNFDSPILLECLGDLLLSNWNEDAKRLAARVYLKASYEVDELETESAYRRIAHESLSMQTVSARSNTELRLNELEVTFKKELAETEEWYANVRRDELAWIDAGVDVDEEFTKKYYSQPTVGASLDIRKSIIGFILAFTAVGFVFVCAVAIALYVRRSKPSDSEKTSSLVES